MTGDLDPITPEAALDYYLDARRYDIAEDTVSTHRYRIGSFVRWLTGPDYGDGEIVNMNDLDLRTIHAYRVFKREENFPDDDTCNAVSMQGQVSTLRVFLNFVAEVDGVPEELPDRIRLPRVRDGEDVDEQSLAAERANAILEYLENWEYATSEHVAIMLVWWTACRLGGVRSLDVGDVDLDDGALSYRHRPDQDTPLKNNVSSERDVSINRHVVEILQDYLQSPHRPEVRDEYDRRPLITTENGRPARSTYRDWFYKWTQPCRIGDPCPGDRDPEECEATQHRYIYECPFNVSPHPVRSGSITAHRNQGTPREIMSDRGDVSEELLEKHYDRATKRERMRRRRDFLPDKL